MKHLKNLVFVCFFCGSFSAFSQEWMAGIEWQTATVDANYCVQLDPTEAVGEWYEMDITAFGFTDEVEAKKQFMTRANNYISYYVNLSEQRAYAHVHLDRTPSPEDIVWWNNYLLSLCPSE
jgi:hypothetical protein